MKKGPIPLVFGITGHRDLREQDLPDLHRIIGTIFAEFEATYVNSPLVLLSSLAEGADRLAAQIALEHGIDLIVPLPMELDDYRTDFETPESRDEFDNLLKQAKSVFVAPGVPGMGPADPAEEKTRSWSYARMGRYILHHCHILIALWDGDHAEKTGGTSQIVRQKLEGLSFTHPSDWAILDLPEAGTVFHIVTPRESNPSPLGALELRKLYADVSESEDGKKPQPEALFRSLLARADAFNFDALHLREKHEDEFQTSLSYLQPDRELGALDPGFQKLLEQFAIADALAISFRRKRHLYLMILCALVVPVSLFLAAYHSAGGALQLEAIICLAFFWISVLLAMAAYKKARWRRFETKHLDYRALAEGFRVLFFWRLAGIPDDIGAQYLRKHWSEVDWIRLAIRTCDPAPFSRTDTLSVEKYVLKHWMIDQREFFRTAGPLNYRLEHKNKDWAQGLLAGGLIVAALMYIIPLAYYLAEPTTPGWLSDLLHWLSLLVVVLLASAGAVAVFAEKLAYAQLSKQYGLMFRLFETATEKYEKCLDPPNLEKGQAILWRLGHEALRENGDWVLLHRERPMEMKIG